MEELVALVFEIVLELLPMRVSFSILGALGAIWGATTWLAGNPESAIRQAAVLAAWVGPLLGGLVLLFVSGSRDSRSRVPASSTRKE